MLGSKCRPRKSLRPARIDAQKEMKLLKNDFSCGVLRVSDYGGTKEGAHDDGSARPKGAAVLLLPPRGSDSRDPPAPADRSPRGFQLRPHPAEELLQPDRAPLDRPRG